MIKKSMYYKRMLGVRLSVAYFVIFLNILFLPNFCRFAREGNNLFHIFLNGEDCGYIGRESSAEDLLAEARRNVSKASEEILYADANMEIESMEAVFGAVDYDFQVVENMEAALENHIQTDKKSAITMKIGDYVVNLKDSSSVLKILQSALNMYQTDEKFLAKLIADPTRQLNSVTAFVISDDEAVSQNDSPMIWDSGFDRYIDEGISASEQSGELMDFDDYVYGLETMNFDNNIEIVEAHLSDGLIEDEEKAKAEIIVAKEKDSIYQVESGDTLSEISEKVNIPMDRIIALNETIDNENSIIRVGDELVITMPEPVLSVTRSVQEYVEEVYDADIQYIKNDDWYTTEKIVRQQPSSGFRNIVARINYKNERQLEREVVKEEVLMEAVPKIVEVGTKIPPTYIKPLSGGRLTSKFGYRTRPTRGASSNHQGIDWSTPVGSSVFASCGGVVSQAGWMGGYGYCVFIKHPDNRETRYGHLSKVLVSKGQSVSQGQIIARSGNTGVSTGPHLHFEIRIGGSAVNPLKYLN